MHAIPEAWTSNSWSPSMILSRRSNRNLWNHPTLHSPPQDKQTNYSKTDTRIRRHFATISFWWLADIPNSRLILPMRQSIQSFTAARGACNQAPAKNTTTNQPLIACRSDHRQPPNLVAPALPPRYRYLTGWGAAWARRHLKPPGRKGK